MEPCFLGTPVFAKPTSALGGRFRVCKAAPAHPTCTLAGRAKMIQSPDSDGPPGLDEYLDSKRQRADAEGAPVTIGTGRANVGAFDGDSRAAIVSAVSKAKESLGGEPQLCHCTLSLDVDSAVATDVLGGSFADDVAIMGRTVNKKDSAGNIEVLLLRSDAPGGIVSASATMIPSSTADFELIDSALASAIFKATESALGKLAPDSPCTFMVYAHSPGGTMGSAGRQAINSAGAGIYAYGGPAVGSAETGAGWALLGRDSTTDDSAQTAIVCAVPGALSFLLSSVVKNWAQPAYTEPLSFMVPTYVGDAPTDLLTAIRYDDWEKFVWCIEEQAVDVNHKWTDKQNQIPLLAACARLRSRMVTYLVEKGADVNHRNDGGFTAAMYTRMLTEHDRDVVEAQLRVLEGAGASTELTEDEKQKLTTATNGRIVE